MKLIEFSKILTILIISIIITNPISSKKNLNKKRSKTKRNKKSTLKTTTKYENGFTGPSIKIRKLTTEQSFEDNGFDYSRFHTSANSILNKGEDFGAFFINFKKIEEGKDHYKLGIPIEFKKEPDADCIMRKLSVKVSKYTFYFPYRNVVYVLKDPSDPLTIMIELNPDYFDDKYYVIKLTLPKDANNNLVDFIAKGLKERVINIRRFLLQKKKLLLEFAKQNIETKDNKIKVNTQNQINAIENTSKDYFLPSKNVFAELNAEILKKNYKGVYQKLNRLNPVGFDGLITDKLR